MKQFFKYFLASFLAGIAIWGIIILIISALTPDGPPPIRVKNNSILHIDMEKAIGELTYSKPEFNGESFTDAGKIGIRGITQALKYAAADEKIKGVYLDISILNSGMATSEEIRNSLLNFKKSGKFIVAYSEIYSKGAYYMASLADEIYLYPTGMLEWNGLGSERMFFKNTLAKLDVDMQIIRGSNNKFKSAVEPYFLEKMSESNRLQTERFVNSFWDHMVGNVSEQIGVSTDQLNLVADSMLLTNANNTVNEKFITALKYEDEVVDILKSKVGVEGDKKLNMISLEKYTKYVARKNKIKNLNKQNIAVVYATGEIRSGEGNFEMIGSETTAKLIRKARKNDSIKALVLRVNSPGGSALASDVIWREIQLTKKVKPVVVSMGDVAASGGYYIACAADRIFAQPNTITGSIGVFGMVPNMEGFFNNKLGVTFDRVQTNEHANIMSVSKALTDEEYSLIQKEVDNIYDDFITKVSEGRGISKKMVDSIGQGRVWTGLDAKDIKLVDEIGGLNDAIAYAAKLANIENPIVMDLPKVKKDPFAEFMEALADQNEDGEEEAKISLNSPQNNKIVTYLMNYVDELNHIANTKSDRIQARMPYAISFE